MKWLFDFLTSSIGKKIIMSLTGLFLCSFLIVHLIGNLQLLSPDGTAFNEYAKFMTTFLPVKIISWGLYFLILLHAVLGIVLWSQNRKAKGSKYAVRTTKNTTFTGRNMALLGSIMFIFIVWHMSKFWAAMKFRLDPDAITGLKDVHGEVVHAFGIWWVVLLYVISMIVVGLHLHHGFQSAFQTLGLNHKKYTPLIKGFGVTFSILITIGFSIIPIWMYFQSMTGPG